MVELHSLEGRRGDAPPGRLHGSDGDDDVCQAVRSEAGDGNRIHDTLAKRLPTRPWRASLGRPPDREIGVQQFSFWSTISDLGAAQTRKGQAP